MRVTHVMSPGPMAGAENVVLMGAQALLQRGYDLDLWVMVEERCPQHGEQFAAAAEARGIPTEVTRVRGRFDLRAMRGLRHFVDSRGTEVIHAHGYKALVYALLGRNKRSSLVVTHHGETGHDRLARLYEGAARTLYRRVDRVFAVSDATNKLLADAGVPRAKIRVIPNPVSLRPPNSTDRPQLSGERLLFVGRLSEEKGVDVLLRALASPHAPSSMTVDIAGDGPRADAWKALATDLGVAERVRWLGVRRDVPELLAAAHALVLPSRREGLPLVILEATSSEVPVIASRIGGVPEAVWENENALLVAPDDVDAWARALIALPERLDSLREGARRRAPEVRARHAPEQWADATGASYEELHTLRGTRSRVRLGQVS